MRIVVMGGTGLIGAKTSRLLRNADHDVLSTSRASGVDAASGVGVSATLRGADVLIDVADAPSFDGVAASEYFSNATRHLLEHAATSGVGHIVVLSVVGADRLTGSGYMRAKLQQEAAIRGSGMPFTTLRSTHTYELLRTISAAADPDGTVRVSPALVQPIAAVDLAGALADVAVGEPLMRMHEIGGPDRIRLNELISTFVEGQPTANHVAADPDARFFDTVLDDTTLLAGDDAWVAPTGLRDWLCEAVQRT